MVLVTIFLGYIPTTSSQHFFYTLFMSSLHTSYALAMSSVHTHSTLTMSLVFTLSLLTTHLKCSGYELINLLHACCIITCLMHTFYEFVMHALCTHWTFLMSSLFTHNELNHTFYDMLSTCYVHITCSMHTFYELVTIVAHSFACLVHAHSMLTTHFLWVRYITHYVFDAYFLWTCHSLRARYTLSTNSLFTCFMLDAHFLWARY